MKIYKVFADSRPSQCMLCPLLMPKNNCGTIVERDMGGGWKSSCKEPDDRCIIHIVKMEEKNK